MSLTSIARFELTIDLSMLTILLNNYGTYIKKFDKPELFKYECCYQLF